MTALRKYESNLDVPFEEIFEWWESRTSHYRNPAMVRGLAQWDRFFLIVQLCGRTDLLHPFIYARCREVERDPDNHADIWAREHGKSSLITFAGTIQEILRDPEITIGIFSHTRSIASKFLSQIKRELETNQKLKTLFPDVLYQNPEKESSLWSNDGIIVKRKGNPKEPTIFASGLVDAMPTGMHFQLRIYDDIVTRESVSTPEQNQKTNEAYSLSQSLGVQNGREWVIGTRYNFSDTYAWILGRGALKPRIYPATHDGTITGRPVFFTEEAWRDRLLKQSEADIACQMLANPIAGSQAMFDINHLEEYEIRPETIAVYILCDPAKSKTPDACDSAMVVLGVDYAGNKYLLDGHLSKMDLQERWKNLANLYVKWKRQPGVQAVYVGYEKFSAQADLDYFKEQQRLNKLHFDITELEWPREGPGSKIDRVQRLVPDIKGHKIFFPHPTDEKNLTSNQRKMQSSGYAYRIAQPIRRRDEHGNVYDLTERLRMQIQYFPFGGKKDAIDAMSRIYDMDVRPPAYREPRYAEPEIP